MNTLEVSKLYRFYHTPDEETLALQGVSFSIGKGEIVAVMGPSGSGKTTLLSCVAGTIEPDGGSVTILGKKMTRRSDAERAAMRADRIGVMLQSGNLFDQLSVYDNILMRMWLARRIDRPRIALLAEAVGLSRHLHALPATMSGGEVARAAIAVALACNPSVLLADEPTGEVDEHTEKQVIGLFETFRKNGGTALIATHSDSLAAHADRVIHLHDGRIVNE